MVSRSQVLFVLGTLLIAMSLQLDRRGVWNMMGPCLFALVIMIAAWVSEGSQTEPAALCSFPENDGDRAGPAYQNTDTWELISLKHPGRQSTGQDAFGPSNS